MFLPLSILVAAIIFFKYSAQKDQEYLLLENKQSYYLMKEEEIINQTVYDVIGDLVFISRFHVTASAFSGSSYHTSRLAYILLDFIRTQNIYDSITLTGTGGEQILVVGYDNGTPFISYPDKEGEVGKKEISPGKEMLKQGEIFILPGDPANVTREGASRNTMRFASPVKNRKGNILGTVAFDYCGKNLLGMLGRHPGVEGSSLVLLDSENQVMRNYGDDLQWASRTLVRETINNSEEGQFHDKSGFYSFISVFPIIEDAFNTDLNNIAPVFKGPGKPPWKLVSFVPGSYISKRMFPVILSNAGIFIFVSIALFIASFSVAWGYEKRKTEALVDPLTTLWNRRFFLEKISKLQGELDRGKSRASLAIIDLGNFKEINDNLGHTKGDSVLSKVACLIRENLRVNDDVARYGGDEFIIFLPGTNKKDAQKILERICNAVADMSLSIDGIELEADFGIGEYPFDSRDLARVIDIADSRMYEHKKNRKAKVGIVLPDLES